RARVPRRALTAGQQIWLGHALLTVLGPGQGPLLPPTDESLVLRLDWRGVSLLLPGDLGARGEALLLERGGPLRTLALKVAHPGRRSAAAGAPPPAVARKVAPHGSRSSSGAPFLEAARPRIAVISVGARNPFRHPSPEAVTRLAAGGARPYHPGRDRAVLPGTAGRAWGG